MKDFSKNSKLSTPVWVPLAFLVFGGISVAQIILSFFKLNGIEFAILFVFGMIQLALLICWVCWVVGCDPPLESAKKYFKKKEAEYNRVLEPVGLVVMNCLKMQKFYSYVSTPYGMKSVPKTSLCGSIRFLTAEQKKEVIRNLPLPPALEARLQVMGLEGIEARRRLRMAQFERQRTRKEEEEKKKIERNKKKKAEEEGASGNSEKEIGTKF